MSITYWECVFVALGVQHATCKGRVLHLCHVRLYNIFSHYLINGTIFERKKKLLHTKCVFPVCLQICLKHFLIVRRTERDMIENAYRSSRKVPVIVVRF